MSLRRSRGGRASVGGRLSGRCTVERRRSGEELVRAGEVAAVVPSAAGRDAGGDSASRSTTPTSTSELTPPTSKPRLIASRAARGFDVGRHHAARCDAGSARRASNAVPRRRRPWRHGLAGNHRRAARLTAGAVARCALGHHAGHQLRPGRRSRWRSLQQRDRGAISVYAKGDDYHELIKPRLKDAGALADRQCRRRREGVRRHRGGDGEAARVAAPASAGRASTPIMVSRQFGSWLFLGAIFTTLELPPDDAGDATVAARCRACLDACPTAAFPAPYRLDARRCISYLTIEHKGRSRASCAPLMGNRIYGCDDCLAVCPWNKFAQAGPRGQSWRRAMCCARRTLAELSRARRRAVSHAVLQDLDQAHRPRPLHPQCAESRSAIPATSRWRRSASDLLDDASPLVRGAAVWALSRLLPNAKSSSARMKARPIRGRAMRAREATNGMRRSRRLVR